MSVSSKLAGIGIGAGAALALFAFAAPSAAADTATGSEATSVVVGTITGHSLTPTAGSVAITIQRSSNGQIVPLRPIYLPMCGFCASAH